MADKRKQTNKKLRVWGFFSGENRDKRDLSQCLEQALKGCPKGVTGLCSALQHCGSYGGAVWGTGF